MDISIDCNRTLMSFICALWFLHVSHGAIGTNNLGSISLARITPAMDLESPITYGIDIFIEDDRLTTDASGKLLCPNNVEFNLKKMDNHQQPRANFLNLETEDQSSDVAIGTTCSLILINGGEEFDTGAKVTFVEDPKILRVSPAATIQSGGIHQTVTGRNFHNHPPVMLIRRYCNGENDTLYDTYCDKPTHNGTQFVCRLDNLYAKKEKNPRCPHTSTYSKFEMIIAHGHGIKHELRVYEDSEVDTWEEPEIFKPYKGQEGLYLKYGNHIKGTFPSFEALETYYKVEVGNETCQVVSVVMNNIMCRLKGSKPTAGQNDDGTFTVKVMIGNQTLIAGDLRYEMNAFEDPVFKFGVIGGVCGAVVLIILIWVFVWLLRAGKCKRKAPDDKEPITQRTRDERRRNYTRAVTGHRELWPLLEEELRNNVEPLRRHMKRIDGADVLENKLGEGNFGSVYKGTYRSDNGTLFVVAIKTCKSMASYSDRVDFLEEAAIMRDFAHPNVLGILAVVIEGMNPYIVLPYMEHGDIKHYIKDRSRHTTVRTLLGFGLDIARGMEYLSNKKFVHRDLAARNCMLDDKLSAKVADFGLARDIHVKDYYHINDRTRALPIKSMAVETLFGGNFTTASDVWSFGILMWEILTRGLRLYADTPSHDLKDKLRSGYRLPKPAYAPQEIYNLMLHCWKADPDSRPSFTDLVFILEDLLDESAIRENLAVRVGFRRPSQSSDYADITGHSKQSDYSEYLQILHSTPPTPMGDED